jgi:FAD/FMN-containing dehydrogenase
MPRKCGGPARSGLSVMEASFMPSYPIVTNTGETNMLTEEAIQDFATRLRGDLVQPGDPDYEIARRVWNGLIDRRPALIARCAGTADVVESVGFARANDLLVSVRGGGHNVAGTAVCEGGLVIDLSRMKGIHVDPAARTARAQGGVILGELDRETQLFGLAAPLGEVSATGIAGLTLGGGLGLLARKYGLSCDNLRSVEIVTADGQVRTASATEHPDLFWAVRGAGRGMGVVTSFEFQLHSIGPEIMNAGVLYPLEQAEAVVRGWRDFTTRAPEEVMAELMFWSVLPELGLPEELHGRPVVAVLGIYAGSVAEGERALQPLRELGEPLLDLSGAASYVEVQSSFDGIAPDGGRYYWKSLFLDRLEDGVVDSILARGSDRPTPNTAVIVRHLGGAIRRVREDATAYGNRGAEYNLSIDGMWSDPADDDRVISWVRSAWDELRPHSTGGVYINFAGLSEEGEAMSRAAAAGNFGRLMEVKRRYDPTGLFRLYQPGSGRAAGDRAA